MCSVFSVLTYLLLINALTSFKTKIVSLINRISLLIRALINKFGMLWESHLNNFLLHVLLHAH